MIDLLLMFFVARSIGRLAEAKGYRASNIALMTAGMIFVGELAGAMLGIIVVRGIGGGALGAFLGWSVGALVARQIAVSLPDKGPATPPMSTPQVAGAA